MWYLYLDESGDLGFDFVNKKPSNFFTVTILIVKGIENNRTLIRAVKKTIRRKLDPYRKRTSVDTELKGERTSFQVKEYFYKQMAGVPLEIFSVTMNKRRAFAWGIFRKYERGDERWFRIFEDKVLYNGQYPQNKK